MMMIKQIRNTGFAAPLLPALFLLIFAAACEQPAGSPAPEPPPGVVIDSAAALAKIGADPDYPLNGAYTLTADITLDGWEPIGTGDDPFTGTFNGNGKTVTISGSGGIFGYTNGAVIQNVNVTGTITKVGTADLAVHAGGIAGFAENTRITSCTSSADITVTGHGHNSSAGGIAGFMRENSSITGCSTTGTITLRSGANEGLMLYAGGIAGYSGTGFVGEGASGCVISRCSYTGTVSAEGGYPYAGGIAGYNYTGAKISECYASGTVTSTGENLPYAGGVAGYNSRNAEGTPDTALIENCYTGAGMAVSTVSASKSALAGGIAGANAANARISMCYARGTVTAWVQGDSAAGNGGTIGVPAAANAGGIAGAQYFLTPSVENCAALNANLSGEDSGTGAGWNIRRIAGTGGTGYDGGQWKTNIANSAMAISPSAAADKGPNGKDGEDCAAKPAQPAFTALGWDFSAVWKMGADGYPALKWQD
jgi:hypothetical protein